MKTSRFNYYIPYKGRYLFFNGMSKHFFFVSEKNYETFLDVVSHPEKDDYVLKYSSFLARMKSEGFVLDDKTDEMDLLRQKFEEQRYGDLYMLMILPTYRCNLSCWYCIQKHQNVDLTDEIVERIKKHIKNYLIENKIKRFRLAWFGGEPLIAYKQLINITAFARDFCRRYRIRFFCDITTNGLLLTSERITELKDLGVRMFQITIDGCREKHNQVKRTKGNVAFDQTVKNVLKIVKIIPDVHCILRINCSPDTLEPEEIVKDLNGLIPIEFRNRIQISPNRIWQLDMDSIPLAKFTKLKHLLSSNYYGVGTSEASTCYVDFKHFNSIFPNGCVDKCEDEKLEGLKGILTESGDIVWSENHPFETYLPLSENSECLQCKHVGFCMGPCPKKRNMMVKQYGRVVCKIPGKHNKDKIIQDAILHYCESLNIGC